MKPLDPKSSTDSRTITEKSEDDDRASTSEKIVGRRRFRELRQRMQTEDDDIPVNNSPPDSQTSSIEGVYPTPSKTSHPFRIIEHDTLSLQSMTSLGRVGRILAGGSDAASISNIVGGGVACLLPISKDSQMSSIASIPSKDEDTGSGNDSQSSSILTLSGDIVHDFPMNERRVLAPKFESSIVLQEPDVIASTKTNGKTSMEPHQDVAPVAPPRRKKKGKPHTPTELAVNIFIFIWFF